MKVIKVVRIRENSQIPKRASNFAVGYDVYASVLLNKNTKEFLRELPVTIMPGESALIGTGIRFAIPWPWQCEVRPRSGLANKYDVELSNSPGTIDPDFRGEAGILLRNRGKNPFTVEEGMRVAQLIFSKAEIPILEEADTLSETIRGEGGFGSTGLFEIEEGTEEYYKEIGKKDEFYMSIAKLITKKFYGANSCLIVKGGNIISMGYRKGEVCAEMDAVTNLLSAGGISVKGADMYLVAPICCNICVEMIIKSGIESVIFLKMAPDDKIDKLKGAGINIRHL